MVSGPRVADNLEIAGHLVAEAVDQGAQMVALPEYFPIIGAADADRVRAREPYGNGPIQDWLAATVFAIFFVPLFYAIVCMRTLKFVR